MALKKKKAKQPKRVAKPTRTGDALRLRVAALEEGFTTMRENVSSLHEDMAALRTTVKHVDERSRRGEVIWLQMQGEQRQLTKGVKAMQTTLELIAEAVHAKGTAQPEGTDGVQKEEVQLHEAIVVEEV